MAEKKHASDDETAMMATYAASFFILWYMLVKLSRALVCAVWPLYVLAAIGTVKILQIYQLDEISDMAQHYYKDISQFVTKEYNKYAPYFSGGKK